MLLSRSPRYVYGYAGCRRSRVGGTCGRQGMCRAACQSWSDGDPALAQGIVDCRHIVGLFRLQVSFSIPSTEKRSSDSRSRLRAWATTAARSLPGTSPSSGRSSSIAPRMSEKEPPAPCPDRPQRTICIGSERRRSHTRKDHPSAHPQRACRPTCYLHENRITASLQTVGFFSSLLLQASISRTVDSTFSWRTGRAGVMARQEINHVVQRGECFCRPS